MVEQLQTEDDPGDDAFLDAFQDELSSTMGKNLDQAFRAQDDLLWDEDMGQKQGTNEDEQGKEVTLQPPPVPQEVSQPNEKPSIRQMRSGHNIKKPGHYRQILMAIMANLIGALLVPILPLSTALLTTQPIIHPTKSMKGATGVIERSILDEPELKPGQGISQAHLDYMQMCDSVYDNMYDDEEDQLSTPVLMLDHRIVKKSNGICVPLAKVNWLCEDMPTWICLDALHLQAPFLVIEYASRCKEVREAPDFSWTKEKLESQETVANMAHAFSATICSSPKFKFGVKVPRNIKHAIELD